MPANAAVVRPDDLTRGTTKPAETTSPVRVKNVSMAALALYFASRVVGRKSA